MHSLARAVAAHPAETPTITPEFREAFDALENSRQNIFLTGKAGTGKSTFLKYFRENTRKNMVVAAPTGVAALNVQGQTIHSLFRLAPRFVKREEIKTDKRRIFKEIDMLVIDEISMVRADVFDGIDHFLRLARKNTLPFGGVQICAMGDLFQLPPIVSREEQAFFAQYYASPYFFATQAFAQAQFRTVEFSTIHRQNDAAFVRILNAIRMGECSAAEMETLNGRVNPRTVPAPGTLVLTTTNAIADETNAERLARLPGSPRLYDGMMSGNFGMNGPRLPAPEQLALKAGAQVMFVKNDSDGRWVNGSIGLVEKLDDEFVTVTTGTGLWQVEREKWKTIGYEFDEGENKIVEKTLGTYTQFPLMLAWAITIHKSQGKTLERVIIDLGTGAFAPGQLYVALSRCKTLSGIALKKAVMAADCRCDARVMEFTQAGRTLKS